jgi:outer membrane protein
MTMRVSKRTALSACVALSLWAVGSLALGQTQNAQQLPDAPALPLLAQASERQATMPAGSSPSTGAASDATKQDQAGQGTAEHPRLTRPEAEQLAIKNNPRVTMGQLMAKAQHQVVREARSAELPTLTGSITAMKAEDASRISAGSLTASRLLEHAGAGATLSQLITDFGRTRNLVASQKFQERAQNARALATTEDVIMATDQAFYNALEAQAMLKVAQQNVETRQTTDKQVNQMTANKLKSTLDRSFADVNLSQSKLLLLDAQNNADATMAALDAVLGLDHSVTYELEEESAALDAPPAAVNRLVQSALSQRPDLQALNYNQQAEVKQAHAQRDQMLPSISALGTAGSVPIRPQQYYTANWWGGVGVNMNIPIFNGFLYSAQAKEASIRAQAASEQSRDLRDRIVRDVRTSWLAANAAYQRVAVTADLLKQANLALNLAETRYKLGLSSIVELSQAQYQQTDAAMGNTNAQYQYRLALANLNYEMGVAP